MPDFWEESWRQVDVHRLGQYINTFDLGADPITEELRARRCTTVCDAGCGCGIYACKLISHGFTLSGFDVSASAVQIAKKLLESVSATAELKTASILESGYGSDRFDAVISRDVIDHMGKKDGILAMQELYRITKPGGVVMITLDSLDSEYETEPHSINGDGDYVFSAGKWRGMVFHPYSAREIPCLIPPGALAHLTREENGFLLRLAKQPSP